MKASHWKFGALALAATLATTIAQSKFSGIYQGSVSSGTRFTVAITGGGRAVGLDTSIANAKGVLNPATSSISADGRFKGTAPNGTSVVCTVDANFKFTGTAKNPSDGGTTYRLSGSRTYK